MSEDIRAMIGKINDLSDEVEQLIAENEDLKVNITKHALNYRKGKIKSLQAELLKHRWIPVAERLPEERNKGYLIYIQHQCPFVATFGGDCFFDAYRGYGLDKITHWKPIILPESEAVKRFPTYDDDRKRSK